MNGSRTMCINGSRTALYITFLSIQTRRWVSVSFPNEVHFLAVDLLESDRSASDGLKFRSTREDPIGFWVQHLNHSAITSAYRRRTRNCNLVLILFQQPRPGVKRRCRLTARNHCLGPLLRWRLSARNSTSLEVWTTQWAGWMTSSCLTQVW